MRPEPMWIRRLSRRAFATAICFLSVSFIVPMPRALADPLTFNPSADARVEKANPYTNFGTSYLKADAGATAIQSYLRFDVSGITAPVQSATLSLFSSTDTVDGPALYGTSDSWTETGITWNNRPAATTGVISDAGAIATGTWVQFDVTSLVSGDGTYDFKLVNVSTDGVTFSSREGASPPQLLVVGSSGTPDTQKPTPPTDLVATAANSTEVDLTWGASSDDVGVVGYRIYRDGALRATIGALTSYSDPASPSTSYTYQVTAFDAAGNESDPSNASGATTQAGDPIIAAAGDIACDPADPYFNGGSAKHCKMRATSDLLVGDSYSAVLALGDTQYDDGTLSKFLQSYDPTWGRVKSITYPVPGNHEYLTAGAAGYFDYFGAAAGDPAKGYYSFDIGAWHVVALNSNCTVVACDGNSAQARWLLADLAAHPSACTLAFWHAARFSSRTDATSMSAIWQDLYVAGADLVLSGHQHYYERFAPMDANGDVDLSTGMREIIVGTGGDSFSSFKTIESTSEVRNNSTFGVLKLTLHPSSYDWQFMPVAGKTFTDSGTTVCH